MIYPELKGNHTIEDFIFSFGDADGFCLLDSEGNFSHINHYSYLGIIPAFSLCQVGEKTLFEKKGRQMLLDKPLLQVMREVMAEKKRNRSDFPFCGGFIGYFTYDFGWILDKFRPNKMPERVLNLPLARFNWYDELFVFDNREKKLFFVSADSTSLPEIYIKKLKKAEKEKDFCHTFRLKPSMSRRHYLSVIENTKKYIASGDIYQANITQRFSCSLPVSPQDFYRKLRRISPAPFGAYLKVKNTTILCNSPERFLYKEGQYVETRPIKGTRKRAKNKNEDKRLIEELVRSEKDRAEHIMIVDLERNDLGRICVKGSVKVKELMTVESYANVHHLVSVVSGILEDGKDIFDCIRQTFPGGSITGAPKLRSMEIIDELETVKRGVYCGAIGYIDASGDADLNIAIRTGVVTGGRLFFNVGGGIVADSVPEEEYEETIIKARAFMAAMGISEVSD